MAKLKEQDSMLVDKVHRIEQLEHRMIVLL